MTRSPRTWRSPMQPSRRSSSARDEALQRRSRSEIGGPMWLHPPARRLPGRWASSTRKPLSQGVQPTPSRRLRSRAERPLRSLRSASSKPSSSAPMSRKRPTSERPPSKRPFGLRESMACGRSWRARAPSRGRSRPSKSSEKSGEKSRSTPARPRDPPRILLPRPSLRPQAGPLMRAPQPSFATARTRRATRA
jgi:hypothetical protein